MVSYSASNSIGSIAFGIVVGFSLLCLTGLFILLTRKF